MAELSTELSKAKSEHVLTDQSAARLSEIGGYGDDPEEDAALEARDGVCGEGHVTRRHEEEQHAERPHVHWASDVRGVAEQLWRCIRWRSTERVQQFTCSCRPPQ